VKKVKSLVKRLIGRPNGNRLPITIDICTKTPEGYCIIGWYLTDAVSSISIKDQTLSELDVSVTDIERSDVVAHLKKPAVGFQLLCETTLPIEQLNLAVSLNAGGEKRIALTLTSHGISVANNPGFETSAPIVSSTDKVKAFCEYALVVNSHIFLCGWLVDKDPIIQGNIVDKRKKVVAKIEDQLRFSRKDVREALGNNVKLTTGFMILLKRTDTKTFKKGDIALTISVDGTDVTIPILEVFSAADDSMTSLKRLLNAWQPHNPAHLKKANMFFPIIKELYESGRTTSARRIDFGSTLKSPKASVIIPLYGRFDFLRYQMSHFNRYDAYQNVEIIFVVDDPNIAAATQSLAKRMAQMVEQPFSLVILAQNMGFGTANNIGVSYASADYIVLMNSDVLPKNGEWLDKMLAIASSDDAGIVGARLLFEDNTIQHDGMAPMTLAEYPGLLFNDHPRKGWPKGLVKNTNPVAPCDLLTAACWVMKKSLFEQLDGFDPIYVLGDFEDSDLCLKTLALGKTNYIRRDVELYHLERQSQNLVSSGGWKHNLTILNAVTFNQRWNDELQALDKELQSNG
jgi:GT2 family glycosyltransferase